MRTRRWWQLTHLHDSLTTVAALLVGLAGSGLFSHAFRPAPPAQVAIRSSLRRTPGARVDFEIALPDGRVLNARRYAHIGQPHLDALDVDIRHIELRLEDGAGGDRLALQASAAAAGNYKNFTAQAPEGEQTVWRLPLPTGMATLRVTLAREYLPA